MDSTQNKLVKWIGIFLLFMFIGSIFWSIIFETLLPMWRSGNYIEMGLNVLGIPAILLGTSIFVYGGWVFVRDTFRVMDSDEVNQNIEDIHANPHSTTEVRMMNFKLLLRAWKMGTIWLVVGFILIAIGGVTINLLTILG